MKEGMGNEHEQKKGRSRKDKKLAAYYCDDSYDGDLPVNAVRKSI